MLTIVAGVKIGLGKPSLDLFVGCQSTRRDLVLKALTLERQPRRRGRADSWEHSLILEGVVLLKPGIRYSRCIGGARACPPKDCGDSRGQELFAGDPQS